MRNQLESQDEIVSSLPELNGLPIRSDEPNEKDEYCVLADLVIPGKGKPFRNGCIVVKGEKITHVGDADDVTKRFSHLPRTHVKVLMPGMWDCHVHLVGVQKVASEAFVNANDNAILTGARNARDCMLMLSAGFTACREVGGYGLQLAKAVDEGSLVGPRIYAANAVIRCVYASQKLEANYLLTAV